MVPRQHSSGGKQLLSSVTKNGNRSLRTLIIHGAPSGMRCVKMRDDRQCPTPIGTVLITP
ncbi:TPA: transposase [Raoultella ornithinolytica]